MTCWPHQNVRTHRLNSLWHMAKEKKLSITLTLKSLSNGKWLSKIVSLNDRWKEMWKEKINGDIMNVVLRLRNKRLLAHTFASALSMSVVICNRSPRLCQDGGIIYVWISICKIRAVSVCFAFCHYPKVLVSKYLNIHSRCENDRIIYV